ncbi:MAG: hypothetical protein OXJ53_06520 [Gammaproteobacteria bacterium]|nr:hypothetical protein [Gammaproteobacteria bacterium]MDE0271601.1 hypothetical protein [Gammaproteobacteria bacterium]
MNRRTPETQDKKPWSGTHARGDGALGYMLSKHLAGSAVKISEEEFIAWASAGTVLDDERKFALYEALVIMDAEEARTTLFDGRAPSKKIADLVVQVGADCNYFWNNLLRWAEPDTKIQELDPDLLWERSKLELCGEGGRHALS